MLDIADTMVLPDAVARPRRDPAIERGAWCRLGSGTGLSARQAVTVASSRNLRAPVWWSCERSQVVGVLAAPATNGRPRQSLVYYVRDGDRLLISTLADRLNARDVRRSGWASLCVMGHEPPYPSATFSGRAEIMTENIGAPTSKFAQRMTGAAEGPEPMTDEALAELGRVVLAITLESVTAAAHIPTRPKPPRDHGERYLRAAARFAVLGSRGHRSYQRRGLDIAPDDPSGRRTAASSVSIVATSNTPGQAQPRRAKQLQHANRAELDVGDVRSPHIGPAAIFTRGRSCVSRDVGSPSQARC